MFRFLVTAERGPVPQKVTASLLSRARRRFASGAMMTPQARAMISPGATMSGLEISQNHIFAAETAIRFYVGIGVLLEKLIAKRYDILHHAFTFAFAVSKDHAIANLVIEKLNTIVPTSVESTAKCRVKSNATIQNNSILKDGRDTSSSVDTKEVVGEVAKLTADCPNNIDFGSSPQNSSLSNRLDVPTSPGQTTTTDDADDLLTSVRSPMAMALGSGLAEEEMAVPGSPGGSRILSSKQISLPAGSTSSPSGAGLPSLLGIPPVAATTAPPVPTVFPSPASTSVPLPAGSTSSPSGAGSVSGDLIFTRGSDGLYTSSKDGIKYVYIKIIDQFFDLENRRYYDPILDRYLIYAGKSTYKDDCGSMFTYDGNAYVKLQQPLGVSSAPPILPVPKQS